MLWYFHVSSSTERCERQYVNHRHILMTQRYRRSRFTLFPLCYYCYRRSSVTVYLTYNSGQVVIIGDSEPVRCNNRLSITTFQSLMQSVPDHLSSEDLPGLQQVVDNRRLIAIIGYSSGTTGIPKGCMHSHYSLVATSLNIKFVCHINIGDFLAVMA